MKALGKVLRNRSTEQDVRDYLQNNGFQGPSARFDYLELKAIERPGWVQVFSFRVRVTNNDGQPCQLLGVVRDDGRKGIEVFLSESKSEHESVLSEWSAGLITLRREKSNITRWLVGVFLLFLLVAVVGSILAR